MTKIDIFIPTYNEEIQIADSVDTLIVFCRKSLKKYDWKVLVADNGSVDKTVDIAKDLKKKYREFDFISIKQKGRGFALMEAWGNSKADICMYMDCDLSTDIKHLPALVKAIDKNEYDIAVGSRNLPESEVEKGIKRKIISFVFISLVRIFAAGGFTDPNCGFKAASRYAVDTVFPLIHTECWTSKGSCCWFWDTEFLSIASNLGLNIYEEPVKWVDDADSTVRLIQDAKDEISGLLRLWRTKPWRGHELYEKHKKK